MSLYFEGASNNIARRISAYIAIGTFTLLLLARIYSITSASTGFSPTTTRTAPPAHTGAPPTAAAAARNASAAPASRASADAKGSAPLVRAVYASGHSAPHPETCRALGARLRLLVLVTSAPAHAAAREAVRLTWGHYRARSDVALAFVLGAPPPALRDAVAAEDALYGDLLVGRSLDSYSNLTLKTLSMLEWTDTYCPRAPFLLKTDDDMFINVPRLLKFAAARVNATKTIWGRMFSKVTPIREVKSKYYLSPSDYPSDKFPNFTTGPAYLMTGDCVRPLLRAALDESFLHLEDVLVTGVVADKVGIARVHAPEFHNEKIFGKPCDIQRFISVHMVRYHEQFDFWAKLLDGRAKCPADPVLRTRVVTSTGNSHRV